jgi:hypothetical protein
MRMPRRVAAISAFVLCIAATLTGTYSWPKSCTLGGRENAGLLTQDYVAYYRGLGLCKSPGFFGRNYYQLRLPPRRAEDGLTDVSFRGEGWNAFRGTYPDGVLREEGECWVTWNRGDEPSVDFHNVRNGKYYDRRGNLGSEIKDGSGIQTYWNCDGTMVWQLELKDYKRTSVLMWDDNGQFMSEHRYVNGRERRVAH